MQRFWCFGSNREALAGLLLHKEKEEEREREGGREGK